VADKKQRAPKASTTVYRLGNEAPEQIRRLVDDRRIKEQEFAQPDVAAVWKKAVEAARDAAISSLSVDSAIRLAYDAGHLAALALLATHGVKPSSGQGHHEMAFYAAAVLGGEWLEDLVAESEEIRGLRKGSMYDPTIAGEAERKLTLVWIAKTLPRIRAALVKRDAALNNVLMSM
jgi:uncharacterized protein (UPF0332 family)